MIIKFMMIHKFMTIGDNKYLEKLNDMVDKLEGL